ncbi:hypothetical protein ACHAW6_003951 [Cyclotella cf. meneghiniana]
MAADTDTDADAAERKRKRLEAWRKRQQQQQQQQQQQIVKSGFQTVKHETNESAPPPAAKVKIGLGLGNIKGRKKVRRRGNVVLDEKTEGGDRGDDEDGGVAASSLPLLDMDELNTAAVSDMGPPPSTKNGTSMVEEAEPKTKKRRRGRWDVKGDDDDSDKKIVPPTQTAENADPATPTQDGIGDALDAFMMKLEAGSAAAEEDDDGAAQYKKKTSFNIDSSGSMVRMARKATNTTSGSTDDNKSSTISISVTSLKASVSNYTYSDWESDAPGTPHDVETEPETDDEEEEKARRAFIEALKKSAPPPESKELSHDNHNDVDDDYETKQEVKSEKEWREERVKRLEREADQIRKSAHVAIDTGRMYNDDEGGVMEEAERTLAALTAAPDALEVLAEMNKKKELRAVDHGSVEYLPIRKNLYLVPPSLAKLTLIDVAERRAQLGVKALGGGLRLLF